MNTHKKLNGFNNGRDTTEGVAGQPGPFENELTEEERSLLLKNGIRVDKWFTVSYPESKEPIAIFKHIEWAQEWKEKYCATGIIEPFEMRIK